MKARRFDSLQDPFIETNIESAKLYAADLAYLQERGLRPPRQSDKMKNAMNPRGRYFKLRIRPDLAARVVPGFPWDYLYQEHKTERLDSAEPFLV